MCGRQGAEDVHGKPPALRHVSLGPVGYGLDPLLQDKHTARDIVNGWCQKDDTPVRSRERQLICRSLLGHERCRCDVWRLIVNERKLNVCMVKLVVMGPSIGVRILSTQD
jgi:hypothetical protein